METINKRVGNFTSSEIWKLTTEGKTKGTFGKPAISYIKEKEYERKLGRSLNTESFSYPTSWGHLCEIYAHSLLPLDYVLQSKEVLTHPTIDNWRGSPDLLTDERVGDIKCPYTMKSFCEMVEACSKVETFKSEYFEYYWQLVSNAILTDKKYIELIVFCPFKSELDWVKDMADNYEGDDPFQFKWIYDANIKKLPYLIDGNFYTNLNIFTFELDEEDVEYLTSKVLKANELINEIETIPY